jgi:hypothetical protein
VLDSVDCDGESIKHDCSANERKSTELFEVAVESLDVEYMQECHHFNAYPLMILLLLFGSNSDIAFSHVSTTKSPLSLKSLYQLQ